MEKVRGDLRGKRTGNGGKTGRPAGRAGNSRQAEGKVTSPHLASHLHHKGLTVGRAEEAKDRLRTNSRPWVWGHCGVLDEEDRGDSGGGNREQATSLLWPLFLIYKMGEMLVASPWGWPEDEMN